MVPVAVGLVLYLVTGTRLPWVSYSEGLPAGGELRVVFIDVGQGDSALICTDSFSVLIDSGEQDKYTQVSRCLESCGIERLDFIITSHPHSDHIGAVAEIIKNYEVGELIVPVLDESMIPMSSSCDEMLVQAERKNIPVTEVTSGKKITSDGCTLDFLAPVREYDDLNDSSLVVKLTYGSVSFLFTGDIEQDAENDMVSSGADLNADILKVPHHGSGTSSTRDFIMAVRPQYAVFSAGGENGYGHPHANIVQRYRSYGAEMLRTDISGNITFTTNGTDITYTTEHRLIEAA